MATNEPITLSRECEAVQIPSGEKITIPAGARVRVTQSLGGAYTVITELGSMARIAGKDADAIGQEVTTGSQALGTAAAGEQSVEKLVWEQLKTCFDPEIPVNIVDLGLVYQCDIKPLEEGGDKVEVRFTLTAPGCGMGDVLKRDIQGKLLTVPGVKEVDVEVVLEPPWDKERMSEAAKLQLGIL